MASVMVMSLWVVWIKRGGSDAVIKWKYQKASARTQAQKQNEALGKSHAMSYLIKFREKGGGRNSPSLSVASALLSAPFAPAVAAVAWLCACFLFFSLKSSHRPSTYCHFTFDDSSRQSRISTGKNKGISFIIS